MSVTIKDIARIANLSHSSVSRALNNSNLVNEETIKKVKLIASELGYIPNYSAKGLSLNKSFNIGLFFPTLYEGTSAYFFYEAMQAVMKVIKNEYKLVIANVDDYKEAKYINKRNFDGIILVSQSCRDDFFINKILENEIPLVVLNRYVNSYRVNNIISDDRQGVCRAIEYLIENGHKKIAFIEGKEGLEPAKERKEGYFDAFLNNDIQLRKDYIVKGEYNIHSGYVAMQKILTVSDLPTAVFCSNDEMAAGALKAIYEKGLKVPGDISVVGFDNSIISSFSSPSLTTVNKPIKQMSTKGAEKILQIINSNVNEVETLYIKTDLVIRESVKSLI
ncbi:LacI family transcriptional regulator [Candidatus Parcubacteria bacterium]|nr:MAG: LacI family transcriptional regulator [Candidatus Parcubacteria bacterium]